MGHNLSIDKYTSQLEDILETNPQLFSKLNPKSLTPPSNISQHLKIWKIYEDSSDIDAFGSQTKSSPVPLHNLTSETGGNGNFGFSSQEAYVVLLLSRKGGQPQPELASFPHSLWGVVMSAHNMTPRGLAESISQTETVGALDSFLLSKRSEQPDYSYLLFVWNGKQASSLVKAVALTKGFELDRALHEGGSNLIQFLF